METQRRCQTALCSRRPERPAGLPLLVPQGSAPGVEQGSATHISSSSQPSLPSGTGASLVTWALAISHPKSNRQPRGASGTAPCPGWSSLGQAEPGRASGVTGPAGGTQQQREAWLAAPDVSWDPSLQGTAPNLLVPPVSIGSIPPFCPARGWQYSVHPALPGPKIHFRCPPKAPACPHGVPQVWHAPFLLWTICWGFKVAFRWLCSCSECNPQQLLELPTPLKPCSSLGTAQAQTPPAQNILLRILPHSAALLLHHELFRSLRSWSSSLEAGQPAWLRVPQPPPREFGIWMEGAWELGCGLCVPGHGQDRRVGSGDLLQPGLTPWQAAG